MTWPPPDPDRMSKYHRWPTPDQALTHIDDSLSNQEQVRAFRQRQEDDLRRHQRAELDFTRRRPFHERYRSHISNDDANPVACFTEETLHGGEERWRNSEGERLADFGLDEDTEFYDEDNIPLAHLLQTRKATQMGL